MEEKELKQIVESYLQSRVLVKKEPASRAPRANRVFTYRGLTFFIITRGTQAEICTINRITGTLDSKFVVSKERLKPAIYALAKLMLAEEELKKLENNA